MPGIFSILASLEILEGAHISPFGKAENMEGIFSALYVLS